MSNHLEAGQWIEPRPPKPAIRPEVLAEQNRQQLFREESHVSSGRSIPGYQRLHGVAPGEMCTLDGRGFCVVPGIHCPHYLDYEEGRVYSVGEAVTITGPPSEDGGGPEHLSEGNDFGRVRTHR